MPPRAPTSDTTAVAGVGSSPAVSRTGVVYIGSQDTLYALDAATGTAKWTTDAGGAFASPVVSNGVIYVSSSDGIVHAYVDQGSQSRSKSSKAPPNPLKRSCRTSIM